uniref:HTH CENPB-type domain-containing protein n=1 Tax=Scleropages formosus TaxID=113540 RepID=A0A8C9W5C8_SCLFO
MDKFSSYSVGFKLKVIDFAEKHGNQAAAGHEFTVTEFKGTYWHKQKPALQNTNKSRKAFRGPKWGKFSALADELFEYVIGLRKDGCCVLHKMVHFKACELATKRGISRTDLKVSRGWITRLTKRKSLSVRRRTSVCQRINDFLSADWRTRTI